MALLKYIYDKKNVGKCAQLPVSIRRRWLSATEWSRNHMLKTYFLRQVS